jgi:hypothetical protein
MVDCLGLMPIAPSSPPLYDHYHKHGKKFEEQKCFSIIAQVRTV